MSASEAAVNLQALIARLRESHAAAVPIGASPAASPTTIQADEPLLGHFLLAFLLWDSTTPKALHALARLEAAVVDFNELRHCMPDELAKLMGDRTPKLAERSLRLRTALSRVYAREHRMSLAHLAALPAKDARAYLESIEGVPAYVAARVCLLGLSAHAAPVDSRICRRLAEAKVVAEGAAPEAAAALLEKKFKPADLPAAYALLQAWADEGAFAAAQSHLDAVPPVVRPAVDKAAREQARKAARKRLKARRPRPVAKKKPKKKA